MFYNSKHLYYFSYCLKDVVKPVLINELFEFDNCFINPLQKVLNYISRIYILFSTAFKNLNYNSFQNPANTNSLI